MIIPESHIRIAMRCPSCKKEYEQNIVETKIRCLHCQHEGFHDITQELDYQYVAARVPFYLIVRALETDDEVILRANPRHLHVVRLAAESFAKAFACEIIDDGQISDTSRKTGSQLLVYQLRIRKNSWVAYEVKRTRR